MRKDALFPYWELWKTCSLHTRSFQSNTNSTDVCKQKDKGIVGKLWNQSPDAYPNTSQLKQLSTTFRFCFKKCQQSHSYFPGDHFRQKVSERLIFMWWNQRAHYLLLRWADCILSNDSYSPGRSWKYSGWGNYGKCIHIYLSWVIFKWKTMQQS